MPSKNDEALFGGEFKCCKNASTLSVYGNTEIILISLISVSLLLEKTKGLNEHN
jgi:hypothetical protein